MDSIKLNKIEIDIETAIKHVKSDLRDDWFPDPFDYEDLLTTNFVSERLKSYSDIRYSPSFPLNFNIPKPGFTLRYSTEISIIDKIVYQSLVNKIAIKFDSLLSDRVYSFRINKSQKDKKYFFKKGVNEWKNFNTDVRLELEEIGDDGFLLVTDITNFYENISSTQLYQDLEILCEDLEFDKEEEKKEFNNALNSLCYTFLNRLCNESTQKGIPQNREASSFIANMYLASVDHEMINAGYKYFRYADDIKIICENIFESRKALRDLIVELRKKGLNVNGGKTYIVKKIDKTRIEEFLPEESKFMEKAEALLTSKEARSLQSVVPMLRKRTIELIKANKTTDREFKFCINRLGKISRNKSLKSLIDFSDIIETIISELKEQPWSTDFLMMFLKNVDLSPAQMNKISNILIEENSNIYSWQSFHIWQLLVFKGYNNGNLIRLARRVITGNFSKPEIAGALLYLGSNGKGADKMKIVESFDLFNDFFTQRYAVIAIKDLSYDKILKIRIEPRLVYALKGSCEYLNKNYKGKFFKPLSQLTSSDIFTDIPEVIS